MRTASILIPAYNEADSLPALYAQLVENVDAMIRKGQIGDYEIWFVNDGSSDDTEDVILHLIEGDEKVHLISFRKNFGKSAALEAGFRHVTGDIVFTMDADLQDDPAELSRFVEKLDEGFDLVVGWKRDRLDPLEKRLPSRLFNAVTSRASGVKLHDHDCGYKCFRREVTEAIDVYGELHRYIPVLAHREGFRIAEIVVNHRKREHGRSKYGAERYMRGLLDFLTAIFLLRCHDRPMYFFGRLGVLSGAAGLLICLVLLILKLCGASVGAGPLLIIGVLLIAAGVQFVSAGFVCNLLLDKSFRHTRHESHIKRIV